MQLLFDTAPKRLLMGETPRLIDEWQIIPKIWDYIRHEVDARKKTAQFILPLSKSKIKSQFSKVDNRWATIMMVSSGFNA